MLISITGAKSACEASRESPSRGTRDTTGVELSCRPSPRWCGRRHSLPYDDERLYGRVRPFVQR